MSAAYSAATPIGERLILHPKFFFGYRLIEFHF